MKAVFFDVGGTLIHPWPSVGKIYAEVAKRHGITITPEQAERAFRESWIELKHDSTVAGPDERRCSSSSMAASQAQCGLTVSRKDWWRELVFRALDHRNEACFEELFAVFSRAQAWRLYPDALDALRHARASKLHVGVISNWDERLRPLLDELDVAKLLDSITVSCEVGAEKPRPEIFRAALEAAGVRPNEALHVGDSSEEDVRGAEAVGMKGVLLERGGKAQAKSIADLRQFKLYLAGESPLNAQRKTTDCRADPV